MSSFVSKLLDCEIIKIIARYAILEKCVRFCALIKT